MPSIKTIAVQAAVTLATIYLYNRFMDSTVASLGVPDPIKK